MVEHFEYPALERDWHGVINLPLGELIENGVIDFSSKSFDFDSYNDEQRNRFWKKFEGRYYFREIGIVPYGRWRRRLIAKLNELMDKYKWAYKAIDEGINPWSTFDEYVKSRNIDSDFPQTLLNGESDYASYGRDYESERIQFGDFIEKLNSIKDVSGIDEMILDELEILFSSLLTVSMNAR